MARINSLKMTTMDVVTTLAEGNPGALTVCCGVLKENSQIDPADAFGGLGPLLGLDMLGLYGPDIWMLFKDVCGENLIVMLAVLRGNQLGYLTQTQIRNAIDRREPIDLWDVCFKVKERLPAFGAAATALA